LEDVRLYSEKGVSIILVGNKVDLYEHRKVPFDAAKTFADSCGMAFIETSAKNQYNVNKAFETAADIAYRRRTNEGSEEKQPGDQSVDFGNDSKSKSSQDRCCP